MRMIDIVRNIGGGTGIIALIGNPIEHSVSPQIHNTISKYMGVDLIYIPFRVEKDNLSCLLEGFKAGNVKGFNVTIPYKKTIMDYLDFIDKEALLIGAVNTVKNVGGKLYGYNTDGGGFLRSFKKEFGTDFGNKSTVVIGAGGAARAIAVKAAVGGAKKIMIVNRTIPKAEQLAQVINDIRPVAEVCSLEQFKKCDSFDECDIFINTTSVGMHPNVNNSPLGDWIGFRQKQIVYDIIYNPPKTKLILESEKKGCKTLNGFGMLLYQAVDAYEIWTGNKVPEKLIGEIGESLYNYF